MDNEQSNGHHLLKHTMPEMERVAACFDGACPKDIARIVSRMGQRDLQAKFNAVYNTVTRSNNNEWLRRKLLEAVGMKMSIKSKCAMKGGARKSVNKVRPTRPSTINTGDNSSQSSLIRCNTADEAAIRAAAGSPVPQHETSDSDTSRQSSMSLHRPGSQNLWHMGSAYSSSPNTSPTFSPQRSSDQGNTSRLGAPGYTAVGVAIPGTQQAVLTARAPSPSPSLPRALSPDPRSSLYFAQPNQVFQPVAASMYPPNMPDRPASPSSWNSQSLFLQFANPPSVQPCYSQQPAANGSSNANSMSNAWSALQPSALLTSHLPQPAARQGVRGKVDVAHMQAQAQAQVQQTQVQSAQVMVSQRSGIFESEAVDMSRDLDSSDREDEDSTADIMHLMQEPSWPRDPAEMAMDEAMDAAIQGLVSEAYSEPFPELVCDVTKNMARVNCCLMQWQQSAERARRAGGEWANMCFK